MLVVRVELWPNGRAWKAKELARVEIANVGGSELFGDYRVESEAEGSTLRTGVIRAHPRRAQPLLVLVAQALAALGYAS